MEPFYGFDSHNRRLTPLRLSVLAVAAAVLAPMVFLSCLAAGGSRFMALSIIFALSAPTGRFALRLIPPRLPEGARFQRIVFVLWIALGALAAYRVVSLGVFMLDVEKIEYAMDPPMRESDDPQMMKPFFVTHNCFTCYLVAAELAKQNVENIYDPARYRDAEEKTVIHETIGDALRIDRYQYPPPFLLLPRLLLATGGDFFQIRTYWFAINVLVFSVTVAALIVWLHGPQFGVCWLAWPILLATPTTLSTLQIGNAHLFVICLSILAMLCFETRRAKLGGALLAFAVVSKIFPGLLLVYLLARRRWWDVGWTIAAMFALCAATLATFGMHPFTAFVSYQLPRIVSGEAFSFAFEYIRPLSLNWSVMGIVAKLDKLGWLGAIETGQALKIVSWLYSGLLLLIVVSVGLRHGLYTPSMHRNVRGSGMRLRFARVWLVILVLAQFRSPFLPWVYGGTAVLWLLLLLLPSGGPWLWRTALLGGAYLLISTHVPLPYGPPKSAFDLSYTLIVQLGVLALCLVLVMVELRGQSHGRSTDQPGRSVAI
ncbi:MAG: DUF2029 domain-containing protein [Planctomycetes bacterium]|nr:DUF2029 domain-containing protein [Planctomycetota bacterium]